MPLAREDEKPQPRIFTHAVKEEWGRGTLLSEAENKREILWEDDKVRNIHASHWDRLHEVELSDDEKAKFDETLRARKVTADAASKRAARRSAASKSRAKKKPPVSWPIQLQVFDKLFPGGFEDEKFVARERGIPPGKPPVKAGAALARAHDLLSAERMKDLCDAGREQELFRDMEQIASTVKSMLHFTEKARLTEQSPEERARFVRGVQDLLYGEGTVTERFDRMVAAVPPEPRPSWTVLSFFSGFARPDEQIIIRPTFWLKQASIVDKTVPYDPTPSGAAYAAFLEVAQATFRRLTGAGYNPRDLMDVYIFAWRTLSPKALKAHAPGQG